MNNKLHFVPLVALSTLLLTGCDSQAIADALKPITDAIEEANKPDSESSSEGSAEKEEGTNKPEPKPPVEETAPPPVAFNLISMEGTPEQRDGMSYVFNWGDASGEASEPVTYEICARDASSDATHCDSAGSFVDLTSATVKLPYVPAIRSTAFYVKAVRGGESVSSNEYTYTEDDFQAQILKVEGSTIEYNNATVGATIGKPRGELIVYSTEKGLSYPKTLKVSGYNPTGGSDNRVIQQISVSDLSSVGIDDSFYFTPSAEEELYNEVGVKDSILVMVPVSKDDRKEGYVAMISDVEGGYKPLTYFPDIHRYSTYRDGRMLTFSKRELISQNRYKNFFYVYFMREGMSSFNERSYAHKFGNGRVTHVSDDESMIIMYTGSTNTLYELTDTNTNYIEALDSSYKMYVDKSYYSYTAGSNVLNLTSWSFGKEGVAQGNSFEVRNLPDNYRGPKTATAKISQDGAYLMLDGAHRFPFPDEKTEVLPYIKVPLNSDGTFSGEDEIRVYAFDTRIERSQYDRLFSFGGVTMSSDQQHLIAHDGDKNYYIGNGEPVFGLPPIEEEPEPDHGR
ncbi:hypothetical protein AOG25_08425 [Vibrio alginolyticus]|nr:hypothetical protein AOG25_08425 [Vibrio alginolyticus]